MGAQHVEFGRQPDRFARLSHLGLGEIIGPLGQDRREPGQRR